jgi:hypothetical protein
MLVGTCKLPGVVSFVVFLVGLSVLARLAGADPSPKDLRAKADAALDAGNHRDAWDIYRKLALDPNDDAKLVGRDLLRGVDTLACLNREDEIDAFRNAVVAAHGKNWRLLQAAAGSFWHFDHFGYIVGGEFHRGPERGGGEFVDCAARDRAETLQLLRRAIDLLGSEPDREAAGTLYLDFAVYLQATHAWRLQVLTDLSKLPDYEPEDGWGDGSTRGAPVDADGNPVVYHVPKTYEAAQSDGERWRWALAHAATFSPTMKNRAALRLADFCRAEFGVRTLETFGQASSTKEDLGAQLSVRTLSDDETIARLANGIQRFKLPDEVNYLRIYRQVARESARHEATGALAALAGYQNRHQFSKAAETWRELIRRFGPGPVDKWKKQLDQILGNWGQFEPAPTQPAVAGRTIPFRFRNAKRLELEAAPINVEKLLGDLKAWLKSNPQRIEDSTIQLGQIGYRLVHENQIQYVGAPVARWHLDLEPRPDHLDHQIEVVLPLKRAGAYLVTAKLEGGNTSRIVLWLADMALVYKPMRAGGLYFVADAVTGRPIAGANIEFFGYHVDEAGRRGDHPRIWTTNFAEVTDADGQATPDKGQLKAGYEWIAIARSGDRLAFLGFEGVWNDGWQKAGSRPNTVFGITDRPVYRPGRCAGNSGWPSRATTRPKSRVRRADLQDSSHRTRGGNAAGKVLYRRPIRRFRRRVSTSR